MNERLVEDWLTKANERSFQTPFAQALMAEGMQILRLGHSPHEHGKDIIAVDRRGRVHAYQLKGGDLDLGDFEKHMPQITALVETQVEHPSLPGQPWHTPWFVISGQASIPVEDRIRVHNLSWKKRSFTPLRLISGREFVTKLARMSSNFWPQLPEDSRSFLSLYLADGKGSLDRDAFAKLIFGIVAPDSQKGKAEVERRLAAANVFASYALSPFYRATNHWELVQGWTITAAHVAWAAEQAGLDPKTWHATFRLAVDAALQALNELGREALEPNGLNPGPWELDIITRSRCTICAGVIAVNILVRRKLGEHWDLEDAGKKMFERLLSDRRCVLWGESAVPFFLAQMWALDQLRGDQLSDNLLFATLGNVVHINSSFGGPKLPNPYDSADEANARYLRRLFNQEKAMDMQAMASYTLASLVTLAARRLWRNALSSNWSEITKIATERLVPDAPRDVLLWRWGNQRGTHQSRLFSAPQSWKDLLIESRRSEDETLPAIIKDEFDFELLFLLCYPHRLTAGLVKHIEVITRNL